jgi:hypothetical protein
MLKQRDGHGIHPLETVVQVHGVKNLISRFFNHGMAFTKKTDAPTVHVLFGPNGKKGQEFRS